MRSNKLRCWLGIETRCRILLLSLRERLQNQAAKSSYKIKFEHVANYQVFSRNCFLRERSEKCI